MRNPADLAWTLQAATRPQRPLPAGAWDTHAHVFGPFDRYPTVPGSTYLPPLAPQAAHLAMLDAAGFDNGVLVHAGANGLDLRGSLDAVATSPDRLHAVAVVDPDSDPAALEDLHARGVRALRFTENGPSYGGTKPAGVLGLEALKRFAPKMRDLGWYAVIWAKCRYLAESRAWLDALGLPVVVDHMGSFDIDLGPDHADFTALRDWVASGNCWIKLTPLRVTRADRRQPDDVRPFHDALLSAGPDRCLFGSDWPYIAINEDTPDIGGQIDLFDRWTGDDALRQKVFVDNPARLFAFG